MAWTVTVVLDGDKVGANKDVGTATCVYDDGAGLVFSFSDRGGATVAERNRIVAKAKAALTAHQTAVSRAATMAASLETALNA